MKDFRAIYLRRTEATGEAEACFAHALDATTIQGAIEQALARLPSNSDIESIDVFAGDDKVETIGVGHDPART